MKKAQIWISAVLYIALSVGVLALVLTAGLPLINKMKDRNTIINTKQLLVDIDDSINTVSGEGPGSRRVLDPVVIDQGELKIDSDTDIIKWSFKTDAQIIDISEKGGCNDFLATTCISEREGNAVLFQEKTIVKDEFMTYLLLNYKNIKNIELDPKIPSDLKGRFRFIIQNDGVILNIPLITIKVS